MMLVFCFLLQSALHSSDGLAEVRVRAGSPLRFHDSETRSKTTTVITGPGGTRKIVTDENSQQRELPTTTTYDSESDTTITGVENPGITIGRKGYYQGTDGKLHQVIVGPGNEIQGGPGSIHTKTQSKTRTTPPIQIEVH